MTHTTLSAQNPEHGASTSPWTTVLWILWIILIVGGVIGVAQRLMSGHLAAGYGSVRAVGPVDRSLLSRHRHFRRLIHNRSRGLHSGSAWFQQTFGTAYGYRVERCSHDSSIYWC